MAEGLGQSSAQVTRKPACLLVKSCMRDADVRAALHASLAQEHAKCTDTRIINELAVCTGIAVVDVAVVNGSLHGFEIKSERDTLARLPGQLEAYTQVFDTLTIVAGQNHLVGLLKVIPEWCGLSTAARGADGQVELRQVRVAGRNPSVAPSALVQLLWREEVLSLLEELGRADGIRSKSKSHLWERLAASLPIDQLSARVRATLKARANWRSDRAQMPDGETCRPDATSAGSPRPPTRRRTSRCSYRPS